MDESKMKKRKTKKQEKSPFTWKLGLLIGFLLGIGVMLFFTQDFIEIKTEGISPPKTYLIDVFDGGGHREIPVFSDEFLANKDAICVGDRLRIMGGGPRVPQWCFEIHPQTCLVNGRHSIAIHSPNPYNSIVEWVYWNHNITYTLAEKGNYKFRVDGQETIINVKKC